jgi:hypothetical protein
MPLRSRILFHSNIDTFDITGGPPPPPVPMTKHGIFWHTLHGNKFQSSQFAIPQSPVPKGRSTILPFVRPRTRRILQNIRRVFGVERTIVIVGFERARTTCRSSTSGTGAFTFPRLVIGSRDLIGRIVGNGSIFLVGRGAFATNSVKGHAVIAGQIGAGHQTKSRQRMRHHLEGATVARL